ncbi:MAG TPA: AAA family ATPase, partial [Candidatus Polarisedimenticolia bacterium]|nr:AAA family ATPase [Candidatus Polarisedimenticolia bacterium]
SPSDPALRPGARDLSLIGIIGQDRAIRALRLGIALYGPGYNVFVCGITGTGRASTVQKILDRIKGYCPLPPDRCYVHNFARPDEPILLALPRGLAKRFDADMRAFAAAIQTAVAKLLGGEEHGKRRERIVGRYEGEGDRLIERFERKAEKQGFALKRVREGSISRPELFPLLDGQAVAMADLEKLASEGKISPGRLRTILGRHQELRALLDSTARRSREILSRMEGEISELERREVRSVVKEKADAVLEGCPAPARQAVAPWLDEVVSQVAARAEAFRATSEPPSGAAGAAAGGNEALGALLERLKVNVLYDGKRQGECPVVVETHPTYRRLFGYFERALDPSGHWSTDHTRIRGGSLLQADGGYLVVTAEDLFSQREIWQELKRTLVNRSLSIIDENAGPAVPAVSMRPQPIPLNVKVIMIGQRESYEMLTEAEPDFRKIFKVLADFDQEMDRNEHTLRQYAAFVRGVCAEEGLGPLDPGALAAVAEFGARMAGRQDKLSTRFGEVADLLREADYWRRQQGRSRRVTARHVKTAVREAVHRSALIEEKLRDMMRLGQIVIDVAGEKAGQVNGLVVHEAGERAFGLPARITATVSPGTAGIINIEREAHLSGRTHIKGVLIIGGFLRETFGRNRPITLTASIAFEQSYGGVDGDSASSTEVYALLSALSGVPIRQGIAVTGSVDQRGEIQPVGGINDKIEGFYRVCALKGLTGGQGVLVPRANLLDLMLDDDVVDAVRRGRFHVHPVSTVGEGMEILTGMPAGSRGPSGRFPEGALFRLVEERLASFNDAVRRFVPGAPPL